MKKNNNMSHTDTKLITVSCNSCGKKNHATARQLFNGIECSSCGMPVKMISEEHQGLDNTFLHSTSCPQCHKEFDVSLSNSLKYLAECPSCNCLFLRKNLIFDRDSNDAETEALKLFETLYPTLPNNITGDIEDAQPASEAEIKLLNDLGIKAENPTSQAVNRLAKRIFDKVKLIVETHYNSIMYLSHEMKTGIFMKVAASNSLRDIYFDRRIHPDTLEDIVKKAVNNEIVYNFIKSKVDVASFEIAIVYIMNYAKVIYEKSLSIEEARMMAVEAFAEGFGGQIGKAGYFIYSHEENKVKNITKLSTPAMKSFYTKRNFVNESLDELFEKKKLKKVETSGCLGVIIFFFMAVYFIGKEMIV